MAPRPLPQRVQPADPNLFVLGMIEATGIGWQGRYEQAELVAAYLSRAPPSPRPGRRASRRGCTGRGRTCRAATSTSALERMAYYVNKDAYRAAVRAEIEELS